MEQPLKAEKTAAGGALTGWRKMLSKAINPESGLMVEDSIMERLKSLDAAWARFDQAHYSLLNQVGNTSHSNREEEQEDWERQMEEYCVAKEEGLAALKKVGVSHMQDLERPASRVATVPHSIHHHRRKSEISLAPSPSTENLHTRTVHKDKHHHRTPQLSPPSSPCKDTQKSLFGCFQRPSLPDEVGLDVAVRDDLVISGHKDFNSLYAANDTVTQSFTVNTLGAPNNSTTMCGCENINCPFCNIVESMKNRDPDL